MKCVEMNWMCILTGPTSSGKTSIVRFLSQITRNTLYEFSMNTGVDTTELLGGFEQVDLTRYRKSLVNAINKVMQKSTEILLFFEDPSNLDTLKEIQGLWDVFTTRAKFNQRR